jgi:TatD DNase family protein
VTLTLIDTHCHVDAYADPIAVLDAARTAGIHVIAVTEDPGKYRLLRTRLGRRDGVDIALGLHPLRASTATPNDLARFLRFLPQAPWIGEIGLDFSREGKTTQKQQLKVFDTILANIQLGSRPTTVHSRGAEKETIERLAQAQVNAILHWYTGPLGLADDALAAGMSFSINPAMTRSKKGIALLQKLPKDRVVLETDGPFATVGNRPVYPTDLTATVRYLAHLWAVPTSIAQATINANQSRLNGQTPDQ